MKLLTPRGIYGICGLALMIAPAVLAQNPSSATQTKQTEKRTPLRKAVWTNDEVAGLRKPSDTYLEQELAAKENTAAGNTATAPAENRTTAQAKLAAIQIATPKSIAEAEQRLSEKNDQISNTQAQLKKLMEEYFQAPNAAARVPIQKKIDAVTEQRNRAGVEVKFLEAKLQELKSNPQPAIR